MGLTFVTLKEGDYTKFYPKDFCPEDGQNVPDKDQVKLFMHYFTQEERESLGDVEMKLEPGQAGKLEEEKTMVIKQNYIRDEVKRLQIGLVGWENAKDEKEQSIKFSKRFLLKVHFVEFKMEDGTKKKFDFKRDLEKHISDVNSLGVKDAGK